MQQRSVTETPHTQPQKLHTDNKKLIARFAFGDKKSNICALESRNCLFLVSIGKENFEKDALLAQLNLINRTFSSSLILVADTLQSHNFLSESILTDNQGISIERSQELAKNRGNQWLDDYKNLIDVNLKDIEHKISVWDEWKKNPDFDRFKTRVLLEIADNSEFAHALEKSIQEYTARLLKRKEHDSAQQRLNVNMRKIEDNCRSYLIEECAVLCMISDKLNYQYIVYPGKATDILAACHKYLIEPYYPEEKLQWLTVRLEKKPIQNSKSLHLSKSKASFFNNNSSDLDVSLKSVLNKLNALIEPLSTDQKKLCLSILNSQFSEYSMVDPSPPSSPIKRDTYV